MLLKGGGKLKESYTLKELAERWKLSYMTIWTMVKNGEIKSFRVGNSIRVTAEELKRIEGDE